MSEHTDFLIKLHLSAIVPLMIADIAKQGDISDWQLERVSNHAFYLAEHADTILYKVPGETAKGMKVLIECIAILAFVPGGVKFAGLHFIGQPELQMTEELTSVQVALARVEV